MNQHWKQNKYARGFTIVEVAAVILILGILAGLTAFSFAGWKNTAAQKAVQSDLQMAATAMESAKNFGAGYPLTVPSSFSGSSDVTITYRTGDSSKYCIEGVYVSNSTIRYFIDSSQGSKPTLGACTMPPVMGETWIARPGAAANQWYDVVYGNGKFVAISNTGTDRVMTSTDGVTWTSQTSAVAAAGNWVDIVYDNGKFVAVGTSTGTHRVMTSTDGITWTAGTLGAYNWTSVAYGNGKFVALNPNTPTTAYTSTDGLTWSAHTGAPSGNWQAVTYGNGRFAAVALSGTNRLMHSSDGITWTVGSLTNGTAANVGTVIYAGGKFVAAASSSANNVMTSVDGITWTGVTVPGLGVGNGLSSLAYTNGMYVGVGTNRVMTSPDAITWTEHTAAEANAWRGVAFGNGRFVAVSVNGTNRVMTSL